jgi:ATP-dependent HslUV protease ATP-binding subunit HslU
MRTLAKLRSPAELRPAEIQSKLSEWIVGQDEAKKSVAVAMRNRWRRKAIPELLRREVIPKNILMIGGSGTGKTEIARRMAELSGAPFIKVEATKFTEVGYRGADVDSIIKDLVEIAVKLVTKRESAKHEAEIKRLTEESLLTLLIGPETDHDHKKQAREDLSMCLRNNLLEGIEVPYDAQREQQKVQVGDINSLLALLTGQRQNKKARKISEVRMLEEATHRSKLLNENDIVREALHEASEYGIVFIDEIDKLISFSKQHADASDEGVQRDLLPLIEGCKITTDRGEVDTSKILFIAAGAFHQVKPSDLIPELQGRLPIRVVLTELTEDDMYRILTEPTAHMIRQQKALLWTEGVDLRVTDDAIREIAAIAWEMNRSVENIGARRLHAVIETLFEELSFDASKYNGQTVIFDASDVNEIRSKIEVRAPNLKQYIL